MEHSKKIIHNEWFKSDWFKSVLNRLNFFKCPYPETQYGMVEFLKKNDIRIEYEYSDLGWRYFGVDGKDRDLFTADLVEYFITFNDCANTAIVECLCYLLTCKDGGREIKL